MRPRHALSGVLLAALVTGLGLAGVTGAATAAETPTCEQARAAVAEFDLDGKVDAATSAATRWDNRAAEQQKLDADADAAAAAAQALANRADAVTPPTAESIKVRDEQRAIAAAQLAARDTARAEAAKALAERDKARAAAATGLQGELSALVAVRDRVCATPTTPPTTTPAPTTTPGPTTSAPPTSTGKPAPTTRPTVPADNNPDDQFDYAPRTDQGIRTGGW